MVYVLVRVMSGYVDKKFGAIKGLLLFVGRAVRDFNTLAVWFNGPGI